MNRYEDKAKVKALAIIVVTLAGVGLYFVYDFNGDSFDFSNSEMRLVITGSMDGEETDYEISTIPVNSLIMVKHISKEDMDTIQIGDVLAYERNNKMIVHRVIEIINLENGRYEFITKGDANSSNDSPVYSETVVGKVVGVSSYGGMFVSLAKEQAVWGIVIIALAVVIIYSIREMIHTSPKGGDKGGNTE
jgi:signal peptidase I